MASEQGDEAAWRAVVESYYQMSVEPSEHPLDLIIWPETAIADVLNSKLIRSGEVEFPPFIEAVIRETGAELVAGGYDMAEGSDLLYFEDQYNTLFHIGDRGELREVYHKNRLLPFGETMPFGPLNPLLSQFLTNVSFFARGELRPLFTLRDGSRFIPAICYEILFPPFINGYLNEIKKSGRRRPHFIVNITNDSWYGDTSEPHQHLFLSRWRAIELKLPIVRSTNTGITSILYPDGTESPRMAVGERGNLDIQLTLRETFATPYQRYGILLSLLVMVVVGRLAFFFP